MMKFRPVYRLLILLLLLPVVSCAHVISRELREQADPAVTVGQVMRSPEGYKGKNVLWGGEIVKTANQEDGSSVVEVVQKPLDWGEEPKDTAASEGRFLIRVGNFLDPYTYRQGRKITAAGEVQGIATGPLNGIEYRYPLIAGKQVYIWPIYPYGGYYYGTPYGYPFGAYYSPFFYRPYYFRPFRGGHFHGGGRRGR
jgi:outer membrane lipoprotein